MGFNEISRTQPKEYGLVLVVGGLNVGLEGELLECNNPSRCLVMDSNNDSNIIDNVQLVRIDGV